MAKKSLKNIRGKLKPKKVLGNYYDPATKTHVCRFCAVSIRTEKFQPGANFAQAEVVLDDGTGLSFNCCADCLRLLDFKDQLTMNKILMSTVEALTIENGGVEDKSTKKLKTLKVDVTKKIKIVRGKR